MDRAFGRHGEGVAYRAELSFDPAIFEPGAGKALCAEAFHLKAIGFDKDDVELIEALGVSIESWETTAIKGLSGFAAVDAWLEESATEEESAWLEESGYMDEVIDMESDFKARFQESKLVRVHI